MRTRSEEFHSKSVKTDVFIMACHVDKTTRAHLYGPSLFATLQQMKPFCFKSMIFFRLSSSCRAIVLRVLQSQSIQVTSVSLKLAPLRQWLWPT